MVSAQSVSAVEQVPGYHAGAAVAPANLEKLDIEDLAKLLSHQQGPRRTRLELMEEVARREDGFAKNELDAKSRREASRLAGDHSEANRFRNQQKRAARSRIQAHNVLAGALERLSDKDLVWALVPVDDQARSTGDGSAAAHPAACGCRPAIVHSRIPLLQEAVIRKADADHRATVCLEESRRCQMESDAECRRPDRADDDARTFGHSAQMFQGRSENEVQRADMLSQAVLQVVLEHPLAMRSLAPGDILLFLRERQPGAGAWLMLLDELALRHELHQQQKQDAKSKAQQGGWSKGSNQARQLQKLQRWVARHVQETLRALRVILDGLTDRQVMESLVDIYALRVSGEIPEPFTLESAEIQLLQEFVHRCEACRREAERGARAAEHDEELAQAFNRRVQDARRRESEMFAAVIKGIRGTLEGKFDRDTIDSALSTVWMSFERGEYWPDAPLLNFWSSTARNERRASVRQNRKGKHVSFTAVKADGRVAALNPEDDFDLFEKVIQKEKQEQVQDVLGCLRWDYAYALRLRPMDDRKLRELATALYGTDSDTNLSRADRLCKRAKKAFEAKWIERNGVRRNP